ncbi:neuronal acetylcholine receptor subunit beta-3 [Brachionus plicatilis]|uniref:Neuronal acetylcholine receptor subunit beta-3 n=1 Tax=Brachionus plicatilis TaxID=10195 RepID=A0A3M7QBI3_BRAPC|nr:neuronal acetylcholine receptor subunit beta-3 [Brachionus plicatilis]
MVIIIFIWMLYVGRTTADHYSASLLEDLLRDYDKVVRPVENPDDYLKLYLGIRLSQIADIDERNQIMTTNVWIRHKNILGIFFLMMDGILKMVDFLVI